MTRTSPALAVVMLGTLVLIAACRDSDADPSAAIEPAPADPGYLLLDWGTTLHIAPSPEAAALQLVAPEPDPKTSSGRVVRRIGDPENGWQRVQTVSQAELVGLHGVAIEGLDLYALDLYVEVGTGTRLDRSGPIEPTPSAPPTDADVVIQTGQTRTTDLRVEWRIASRAEVWWPDGTPAGEVREPHAFVEPGVEVDNAGQPLTCFDARVGPPFIATPLCFEPSTVSKGLFQLPPSTPEPASGLLGEPTDAVPTGRGMTGTGAQNGAPSYSPDYNGPLVPPSNGDPGYGPPPDAKRP